MHDSFAAKVNVLVLLCCMITTHHSLLRLKFVYPTQTQAIHDDIINFKNSLHILEDSEGGV